MLTEMPITLKKHTAEAFQAFAEMLVRESNHGSTEGDIDTAFTLSRPTHDVFTIEPNGEGEYIIRVDENELPVMNRMGKLILDIGTHIGNTEELVSAIHSYGSEAGAAFNGVDKRSFH